MRSYLIQVTHRDGSVGHHHGLYSDGFEAVIEAMTHFPNSKRISAQRIV